MMTVTAVAFDLDYTLAVPTRDRQVLLDEATTAAGAPSFSREAYLDAHRRVHASETREPIFERLLDAAAEGNDLDASPDSLAATYRETIEESLVPVAGVEALLADLRERYRLGVLTDGPVLAQQGKLDALGWNDAFDAVVITGALDAAKPDERAFAAILDALSTTAEEAVYVGDDPEIDVAGAAAAGLHTVQVIAPGATDSATDPEADATVRRDALAERLPGVLGGFE